MISINNIDGLIDQYHAALIEFLSGNFEPAKKLFSHKKDVTLANSYMPFARGWKQVAQTLEHEASLYRDREVVAFEIIARYATSKLAYVIEIEHLKAKAGTRKDISPYALRVTTIFRSEDGVWKVVHQQVEPITRAQPVESEL